MQFRWRFTDRRAVFVVHDDHDSQRDLREGRKPCGAGARSEGLGNVNAFEYRWAANGTASEGQRTPDGVPANPSDFRPRSPPLLVAYNYDRVSITLHAHPLAFAGATAQQQTRTEERRLQMDFGLSKKFRGRGGVQPALVSTYSLLVGQGGVN